MKVCIVGGGGSAAVATRIIKARMPEAAIEVFTERDVAGYRPCELTYVLGKKIPGFDTIVAFDAKAAEDAKITYRFRTAVKEINRTGKYITTDGGRFEYDKLILATGAAPVLPGLPGMDGKGIYVLGTDMQYARDLEPVISRSRSALILGAGAIGLELAEILAGLNYERVVVADVADRPLARSLDREIAGTVTETMSAAGVEFIFSSRVLRVEDSGTGKRVNLEGREVEVDFVAVAAGFRPNARLARDCGLEIGDTGGIMVGRNMVTSDPDIYAIGDVAESWDVISGQPCLSMKADNAVRTAKVAGRHLTGDAGAAFSGTAGGFIINLMGIFVGAAGYTGEAAAAMRGDNIKTVWHEGMTLPKYLGGHPVKIKLVGDRETRMLLGAQMISKANVAAELDRLSLAISEKISIERLAGSEIVYTPASGWPYGPVAQALDKL